MIQTTDRGVRAKSTDLRGRNIGVGVCGGIGAVEIVKIIRELRRHGAEVHPFLTPSVERFVTSLSIEWAAGRKTVREADAEVGHLEDFDLFLVAPVTLNTLVKASLGLADNAVTLALASHLGQGRPTLMYPTMNDRLRRHPRYETSVAQLAQWGVRFPEAPEEEGRRKMPSPEQVAAAVREALR